ncbi:MAG: enoyl-ACP reductase [Dehalococcoidia bacterium]
MAEGLLAGKTGLVMGVANRRSIAWGIARALAGAGARLAFSYQGERIEQNVRELAATLPDALVLPCDVADDAQIDALFAGVEREFGGLDLLVHAIAFAPTEALTGRYLDTGREAFRVALEVSAYSLTAVMQRAAPLMERRGGGSALTLTYLGGERVMPNYNVMGVAKAALDMSARYLAADLGPRNIRVNVISAGPVSTLSSRAIHGVLEMLRHVRETAPLRRDTDLADIAGTALYLCSDLARGVTGEVIHVDSGFHVMGLTGG